MKRRKDVPFLFDVKTELAARQEAPPTSGPAQVATDSYRRGWDAVWGRRSRSNLSN